MTLYGLYGASKPPLRTRTATRVRNLAQRIWTWADLDRARPLTEIDLSLMRFVSALDDLANAIERK